MSCLRSDTPNYGACYHPIATLPALWFNAPPFQYQRIIMTNTTTEPNFDLRIIPVTPFGQNCSLLWDTNSMRGVLIDPGGEAQKILHGVKTHGVTIEAIWLTHGHLDHAGGAAEVKEALNVPIIGPHKDDQYLMDTIAKDWEKYGQKGMGQNCKSDTYLNEGDTLTLAGVEFGIVHCPGHTPGSVVIYNQDLKLAFVGDVLFKGSIGRTDFPKGDLQTLLNGITGKLWPLGNEMRFVSGHGEMSTFGAERASNPFVGDQAIGNTDGRSSGIM